MVTLQNHVLSILAKSAKTASDDIIKLFDSSFEAFSDELRKRQDEINTLRMKLEESEPKPMGPNSSGPAFLCVQCGVSLNCVIPIEEIPKDHNNTSNESPQIIETDFSDHQPLNHVPIIEGETDEDFEFEVGTEEDTIYSQLIQEDKNTETVQQEEPTIHKKESNPPVFPQKRGRGRPRKQPVVPVNSKKHHVVPVYPEKQHVVPVHLEKQHVVPVNVPPKRGRGRPRKTEVVVTVKSQPNTLSAPEQPNNAQIRKEIVSKPQPVQPTPPQTSTNQSVSKKETGPKVELQATRSGRRGRPPRRLLDPLLIPFAGTKSILSGPKNHECEPVALTNKFKDNFVPKTVEPVPMPEEPVPLPEAPIPITEEPVPMIEEPVPLNNSEKDQPYKTQPKKEKAWFKCPDCPREYPKKSLMLAHKKIHYKKGESACHICGLTFVGVTQMTNHMRVHTGEKPYSCHFCPRRFPSQSRCNKHILSHAPPDYECEVCGLKSSQVRKTLQKAHLRCKEPCSNCASIYT